MIKLLMFMVAALIFPAASYGQEPLLPEQPLYECPSADEPLDPDSSEARRLLESDDPEDRACATQRIGLWELLEAEVGEFEEARLNPSVRELQLQLIELLQQLQQLLIQKLQ